MIEPREYQKRALDACIDWMRKNYTPCFLDLSMSAGKSVIGALIAKAFVDMTGKKVVITCPTSDLVLQNAEKVEMVSGNVSIYSASIDKDLRHNVVVCTPQTFSNAVEEKTSGEFGLLIIDEGEGVTKDIKLIYEKLLEKNPKLRVVGMSGTPYRTGEGYVAEIDLDNSIISEAMRKPFYKKIVARVPPRELINLGYAVPEKIVDTNIKFGEDVGLTGEEFTQKDQDIAFLGQGRKTSQAVENMISYANSIDARGVIIYATSIKHCDEIMASMPNHNTAIICGGKGRDKANKKAIQDFRDRKIKYLINVNMATVGLSVDHVDLIVIMRLTGSARLYQQILGRGMRLLKGEIKECFHVMDFTKNIENLFPSGDVFNPDIKGHRTKENASMTAYCPDCGYGNEVQLRPNPEEMPINENGYYMTLSGNLELIDGQPFPAHYTRRCGHMIRKAHDQYERCSYFWTFKECECGHKNDIVARFCESCKEELIDPNEKLQLEFEAKKKDLRQIQTDEVIFTRSRPWRTKAGGDAIKLSIGTHARIIEVIVSDKIMKSMYQKFKEEPSYKPQTVTYKKSSSGFFYIYDFNRPTDISVFNEKGVIQ